MDKYTKFILTVIAFSLLWISIQAGAFVSNVFAANDVVKIEIVDVSVSKMRALPIQGVGEFKCRGN